MRENQKRDLFGETGEILVTVMDGSLVIKNQTTAAVFLVS